MAGQQTNWDQCLEYVALSDIGMRRAINQDAYAAVPAEDIESWRDRGHLFVVADGMGAHVAGEMASQMAVQCVPHVYLKHRGEPPSEAIKTAVLEANAQINRRGNETIEFYHMGTTCSALLLLPQGALAAHVGDSRIYRLRDKYLEQLTFDHSLVWEIRAAGQMPKDERKAAAIPKNVITRSLGPHPAVEVDLEGPFPTAVGDTFLLCSDGLTGEVSDEELGPILSCLEPAEAAPLLVHLANLRGGPDNITLIIVKVTGPQLTTRAAATEPLPHAGGRAAGTPKAVHPALWVVIAACLLAGVGMVITQQPLAARLLAAAAGGAVLLAVAQKFSGGGRQRADTPSGQRFGSGPHSKTACRATRPIVKTLAEISQQLRAAAEDENWSIDRSRVSCHIGQAASAASDRRYPDAVRESSRAIRIMMDESRCRQEGADRPDSASP